MITKTDFMAYLDAPMHLWAVKNNLIEEKALDDFLKHLFEQGYQVEEYADKYFKEILIPEYDTKDIFFQAKAVDGQFEARLDFLIKNKNTNKWDIYEVKSSTKVKKEHKYDVTFQAIVFEKKFEIGNVYLLHLNKDYKRKGPLKIEKLFKRAFLTDTVDKLREEVKSLREEALATVMIKDAKQVKGCLKPKTCPSLKLCHPNLPEYSIFDINRIGESKKRQLLDLGIKSVYDVPDGFDLSVNQAYQVNIAKIDQKIVKKETIKNKLKKLKYPLFFIDYETFNQAIPAYDGYHPYDHLSFQWSLLVKKNKTSELEHYQFIEEETKDPTIDFLSILKPIIGDEGSIIVWNKTFEKSRNKEMAKVHSEFKDFCENMNDRIFDLMEIFSKNLYVDPKFKGSYSIKKVLPVLVPELSYLDMEIGEGATAMIRWYEMIDAKTKKETKEKIKQDLLAYCKLDTMAMVKIYERLVNL